MEGALILPSEDDNNTFSINFSTGEVYKMRAVEAKERQVWVDKLRACSNGTANSRETFVRSVMSPSSQSQNFSKSEISPAEAFSSVNDILMVLEYKQCEIAQAIDYLAFAPRPEGPPAPESNLQCCWTVSGNCLLTSPRSQYWHESSRTWILKNKEHWELEYLGPPWSAVYCDRVSEGCCQAKA